MMADCEEKAGKARDMAQGMMDDMKSVSPADDIAVIDKTDELPHVVPVPRTVIEPTSTTLTNIDILDAIKRINGGK